MLQDRQHCSERTEALEGNGASSIAVFFEERANAGHVIGLRVHPFDVIQFPRSKRRADVGTKALDGRGDAAGFDDKRPSALDVPQIEFSRRRRQDQREPKKKGLDHVA